MSDMRDNDRPPLRGGTPGASGYSGSGAPPGADRRDAKGSTEQAHATAGAVRDEAAGVQSEAKAEAAELANKASEQAESFAKEHKATGAKQVEGVARAVHRAADELEGSAPQLAGYVREAGDAASRLASNLHERSLGSLAGDVQEIARRQPVAFFGAAVLAGFALSRFIKSSAEDMRHSERDRSGEECSHRDDVNRGMARPGAGGSAPKSAATAAGGMMAGGPATGASEQAATGPSTPTPGGQGSAAPRATPLPGTPSSSVPPAGMPPMGTQR